MKVAKEEKERKLRRKHADRSKDRLKTDPSGGETDLYL